MRILIHIHDVSYPVQVKSKPEKESGRPTSKIKSLMS